MFAHMSDHTVTLMKPTFRDVIGQAFLIFYRCRYMPWFPLKTIRLLYIHPPTVSSKKDTIIVHSWALSLPWKTMDAFVNLRDTEISRLSENIPIAHSLKTELTTYSFLSSKSEICDFVSINFHHTRKP